MQGDTEVLGCQNCCLRWVWYTEDMSTHDRHRAAFKEAYASLNAAQTKAVDTIEGPVMVIAGPGTGKTQILTLRIANILLQTDTAPESILALTFTESGAKAMRQRLHRYIGSQAYQVGMHTFHGFAQRLIHEYPDMFPRMMGGRVATDIDKITTVTTIIEGGQYKKLRPMGNPAYYIRPIINQISQLKQEYITPEVFPQIIARQAAELADMPKVHEKGAHKGKVRGEYTKLAGVIEKNIELLEVFRLYETSLREQNLYDFDDMIIEVVTALKTQEDLLRSVQEQFQYVLADEHQDVNGSQNKILELISSYHERPNIFVVGDEKQAIYRFQGASLENFLYFEDLFPHAVTIALTDNYRSGQPVLDAAHSLVAVEDGPLAELRIALQAALVPTATVERRDFSHQVVEDEWLADSIESALAAGTEPQAIAVIVRTNKEVSHLAGLLRKKGIAVTASADGDILSHPITYSIRSLLAFVLSDGDELPLATVLHGAYWGFTPDDVFKIMRARQYDRSLMVVLSDEKLLTEVGVESLKAARTLRDVHTTARSKDGVEPPHRVLEYILEASGFLAHVMTQDPLEGPRVVRRLYDEVEAMVIRNEVSSLHDIVRELRLRQSYNLALNAPYITTDDRSVQVMTAHKSKGLEFETVFVPHLHDKGWGGATRSNLFTIPLTRATTPQTDALDDERRLLYVAMTRAKSLLCLSSADTNAEGKALVPSRLYDDIEESLLTTISTDEVESSFAIGESLVTTNTSPLLSTSLVVSALKERGFSATSLNNYLKNPWDYLYRNVLRLPEVQPTHMQFGTAVHNVLQRTTRYHTEKGSLPSTSTTKSWLEAELNRLPINIEEYTRLHEKGFETLCTYHSHLEKVLPQRTIEEKKVSVVLETGIDALPELPLTGNLDRIDFDESGQAIRVVDYKTGTPKSRNVIEGKTAQSDGGYKRQLVFYALLLSLLGDDRYVCRNGVLSFVEATPKGEIKEEVFTITDTEIEELQQEIIGAVQAIVSGDFLDDTQLAEESEYADLAKQLLGVS